MVLTIRNFILGLLSELLVMIAILLVLYLVLTWLGIPTKINTQQSITVDFDDATQLAAGSPVRWMGVDVGYVESVKPERNQVIVRLRTEPGTPKIPPGSHFTIEFNGLAGAKSLEITQPEKTPLQPGKMIKGFDVQKPIRIEDVQDTSILVAEGLEYSMDNIRESLEQIDKNMPLYKQINVFNTDIKNFTNQLMSIDKRVASVEKGFQADTEDVIQTLDSFSEMLKDIPSPQNINQASRKSLTQINEITNHINNFLNSGLLQSSLKRFNQYEQKLVDQLKLMDTSKHQTNEIQPPLPPHKMTAQEIQDNLYKLKKNTEKLKEFTQEYAN